MLRLRLILCIVTQIVCSVTQRVSPARSAYAGFAVFGAFWGVWGASIPALRHQAGLTDGELGTALLFIGAGALPMMPLAGRAVDRWGRKVAASLLAVLGVTGVAVAAAARDFATLSMGLALLGAASGGADVAINAAAGSAERATGRPVIARAHGVFSAAVVIASLGAGLLLSAAVPLTLPFLLVTVTAGLAAAAILATPDPAALPAARRPRPALPMWPLLVAGGLGALAFAVENAHQSWSALYLSDVMSADPAVAAAGPAVFAAIVAITRFALSTLDVAHAKVVVAGATTAAAGSAVVAAAMTVPVALAGLALAAAGTAVLFPTLLSAATAQVDESARGAATSVVSTVAYLGFLAGPAYVGGWAAATSLPGAMLAVAGLGCVLVLLAGPGLRLRAPAARPSRPRPRPVGARPPEIRDGREPSRPAQSG
jgi:MFS family permease